MINITIDGENAEAIQREMRALLNGQGGVSAGNGVTGAIVGANETAEPAKAVADKRPSGRTRAAAADKAAGANTQAQGIQTGEERVDPEAEKHDAADEKAETETTKPIDLTHDDVKKMLGGYVQAYGMTAAQEDGTGFIGAAKISEIPNTQAALAAAVIGIAKAIEGNPKKRDIAGDGLSPEKTAELKVLVTAAQAVK